MAQHTPGPWAAQNADLNGATHYLVAGKRQTLLGVWTEGTGLGDQAKANLHLIEAAPDLLDVARMLVDGMDPNTRRFDIGDCVMRAHAAIAKAEGRS